MGVMKVTDEGRRSLLLGALSAAAVFVLSPGMRAESLLTEAQANPVDKEALASLLAKTFHSDDPGVRKLVTDAYLQCIVEKIHPPDPPLEHNWLAPGGAYYAQWVWDTVFVLDLLALLPGQEKAIRGVFQNYWDFQRRWNETHPECMHGMIANFIAPFDGNQYFPGKEWKTFPAFRRRRCWRGAWSGYTRRTETSSWYGKGCGRSKSFTNGIGERGM
jgi:hypothetical protein